VWQTAAGKPNLIYGTPNEPKTIRTPTLRAAFEQELHTEADTDERRSILNGEPQSIRSALTELPHGMGEVSDPRQNDQA
jgi:hypothetical protein